MNHHFIFSSAYETASAARENHVYDGLQGELISNTTLYGLMWLIVGLTSQPTIFNLVLSPVFLY